jgi:hypothetical protein
MSSYVAEFYRRRKRGIAVSLSVAGGLYLLVQYAKSKFEDAQQRMLDERAAEDKCVDAMQCVVSSQRSAV